MPKLLIKETQRSGGDFDKVVSFNPSDNPNYLEETMGVAGFYKLYTEVYDSVIEYLAEVKNKTAFQYQGVDLLWCFKKDLFEQVNYSCQRYQALKHLAAEHSSYHWYLDSRFKRSIFPGLDEIIKIGPLVHSLKITELTGKRADAEKPLRADASWKGKAKDFFWRSKIKKGNIRKSSVVIFSSFEKSVNILKELKVKGVFYSNVEAPKIFTQSLRHRFNFYQAACSPRILQGYHIKTLSFLDRLSEKGLFDDFKYADIQAADCLRTAAAVLFGRYLDRLLFDIDAIRAFFQAAKSLKTALLDEDISYAKNAFCQIAAQHGVETYVECHGALGVKSGFLPLAADHIFVWGNKQKNRLIQWGCSLDKIVVSGCSRYNAYQHRNPAKLRIRLCRKTGLDIKKKIVLVAPHPVNEHLDAYFFRNTINKTHGMILDAIKACKDIQFAIKLHPGDANDAVYRDWIAANQLQGRVVILKRYDSLDLALAVDFLIVYLSTYAIDAFALGKNVICVKDELTFSLKDEYEEYNEFGVFYQASTLEELTRSIGLLAADPQAKKGRIEDARRECLNEGEGSPEKRILSCLLQQGAVGGRS